MSAIPKPNTRFSLRPKERVLNPGQPDLRIDARNLTLLFSHTVVTQAVSTCRRRCIELPQPALALTCTIRFVPWSLPAGLDEGHLRRAFRGSFPEPPQCVTRRTRLELNLLCWYQESCEPGLN